MATNDQPHKCEKTCFVCERGYDVFSHVHVQPIAAYPHLESYDGPELVICIPCIAELSGMLDRPITAYRAGGHVFDAWARAKRREFGRGKSDSASGIPVPPWLADVLNDILSNQEQEGPDAG